MARYILLCFLILAPVLWTGCGDEDDNLAGSEPAPPPGWIDGDLTLYYGMAELDMHVFQHGGAYLTIDSVIVGDSQCFDIKTDFRWNESNPYWDIDFNETGDAYMYRSGDTARVSVYGDGRSCSCRLVVLDEGTDILEWISPIYGTTAAPGEDIDCYWHKLDPAEWYGIEIIIRRDINDVIVWDNVYSYAQDTTYTVTADALGDSVTYFHIYALPTTGPDLGSTRGNWTGGLAEGKLYSHGAYGYTRVYVRQSISAAAPPADAAEDPSTRVTGRAILRGVLGTFE